MQGISFWNYYKMVRSRLDMEASPWARDNILWAVICVIVPPLSAYFIHQVTIDWPMVVTALWLYSIALFLYLVFHVARAPWRVHQEIEGKLSDTRDVVLGYEVPKLKLVFEPTSEYTYDYMGGVNRLYKVAVRNISGKTIRGVCLALESVEPCPLPNVLPLYLHPKDDLTNSLHPGQLRFFDVVQMARKTGSLIKFYPSGPSGLALQQGHYLIQLAAYGEHVVTREKMFFEIDVNPEDQLLFAPLSMQQTL